MSAETGNARSVQTPVQTRNLAYLGNSYDLVAGARLLRTRLERRLAGLAAYAPKPYQSLETVVDVNGGADGSVIGQLPIGFYDWCEGEKIQDCAVDSLGNFRPYYIDGSNGNVVDGPIP